MWGETRIAYSCFLPDTEGGRWRAKERKEGKQEEERERALSPLCDVHWCSCSSRSNAASVLCSSSSRLPSAPLNYSQPEDVQCGCLLLSSLSSLTPRCSLPLVLFPIPSILSHVMACFRGNEQKFSPCKLVNPPPYPTSTHLPSTTHLSSLSPYLTLLLSSLLVSHWLPDYRARYFFFKMEAASCSHQLLCGPSCPSASLYRPYSISFHWIRDAGFRITGCFPFFLFYLSPV